MKNPTWLDEAIEAAIAGGDPATIALAVANSPQFLDAIKWGLARKAMPGTEGASQAQVVAEEIKRTFSVS